MLLSEHYKVGNIRLVERLPQKGEKRDALPYTLLDKGLVVEHFTRIDLAERAMLKLIVRVLEAQKLGRTIIHPTKMERAGHDPE